MNTRDAVHHVIADAIVNHPRSLQVQIGPSEIGLDCDRCLGHRLAGTPKRRDADWQPYVGVSVHAQLERVFLTDAMAADARGQQARWAAETKVWVGQIDGEDIHGSCDLLDAETGTVVDFKTASKTQLKNARVNGPSEQYRIQAHLYGRGWQHNGINVQTVALCYLPRDAALTESFWWSEPYDEQVALDALARADSLAKAIRIVGAEQILPTLTRKPNTCWDCQRGRYPTYPTDPPLQTGAEHFADLIPA